MKVEERTLKEEKRGIQLKIRNASEEVDFPPM